MWMCYSDVLNSDNDPDVKSATCVSVVQRLESVFNTLAMQNDHDALYKCYDYDEGNNNNEFVYLKKEAKKFENLQDLCTEFLNNEKSSCPVCFYEDFTRRGEEKSIKKYRESVFYSVNSIQQHLKHLTPPPATISDDDESTDDDEDLSASKS